MYRLIWVLDIDTVCVKDRGRRNQKYQNNNFSACFNLKLDSSHVEI